MSFSHHISEFKRYKKTAQNKWKLKNNNINFKRLGNNSSHGKNQQPAPDLQYLHIRENRNCQS